jgi:hypothetical protein
MSHEDTTYTRTEQLPPNYLGQFYSGVPGTNVPGMMPLLNQELVNRMMGFGVAGANPYTYQGNRIAGFTPATQEGFRQTAEGMGSYLPYFQKAEELTGQGLGTATGAYGDARNLIGQAVGTGQRSTGEAMNLLRQTPGIATQATGQGLGHVLAGGQTLGQAAGAGQGATQMYDPSAISDYYNPFEESVVQQTLEDVREGLAQSDIARRSGAVGAGAFGGSRSRLLGEELVESAGRGAAKQIGAIRSGGYQDAARRSQQAFEQQQARQGAQAGLQQAGMGGQIAGMGGNLASTYGTAAGGIGALGGNLANVYGGAGRDIFGSGAQLASLGMGAGGQMAGYGQGISGLQGTDINRMMGMGGMQQGMDQRRLSQAYGDFVGQYNLPMQTFGQIGNMATGWAPGMGGSTLQQHATGASSNPYMTAAGMGLSAMGIGQG